MYAEIYTKESEFYIWVDCIELVDKKLLQPGYHARYIDPEKQELGFIIYDEEFGELTPEAQQLYLEVKED